MLRPWALGLGSWVSKPTAYIGLGLYIQVSSSYHKISARYTRAYQQGFPYGKFGGESQKKHRQVLGGVFYGEKFGGGFMGGGEYLSRNYSDKLSQQ